MSQRRRRCAGYTYTVDQRPRSQITYLSVSPRLSSSLYVCAWKDTALQSHYIGPRVRAIEHGALNARIVIISR